MHVANDRYDTCTTYTSMEAYLSLVNHTPYVILPRKNDVRGVVYETKPTCRRHFLHDV